MNSEHLTSGLTSRLTGLVCWAVAGTAYAVLRLTFGARPVSVDPDYQFYSREHQGPQPVAAGSTPIRRHGLQRAGEGSRTGAGPPSGPGANQQSAGAISRTCSTTSTRRRPAMDLRLSQGARILRLPAIHGPTDHWVERDGQRFISLSVRMASGDRVAGLNRFKLIVRENLIEAQPLVMPMAREAHVLVQDHRLVRVRDQRIGARSSSISRTCSTTSTRRRPATPRCAP